MNHGISLPSQAASWTLRLVTRVVRPAPGAHCPAATSTRQRLEVGAEAVPGDTWENHGILRGTYGEIDGKLENFTGILWEFIGIMGTYRVEWEYNTG